MTSNRYSFSEIWERRSTHSDKWNLYDEDVIPMWIADSDYAVDPKIVEILSARLKHPIFGYTGEPPELRDLIVKRMKSLYDWKIEADWICFIPGVVPGLNISRLIVGKEGDEVITAAPVYPHLLNQSPVAKRVQTTFPMIEKDGRFTPDFKAMDETITKKTKLLLLCNPHNPVGTVYSDKELEKFAKRAEEHDLIICSDEIHADLIIDKNLKHRPIATLSKSIAERTITLMAASKTFNIAGLSCSYAIIPDKKLRTAFMTECKGLVSGVNLMGYLATEAAYKYGDEWLEEQLDYLRDNVELAYEGINKLRHLSMNPIEATFLGWINVEKLNKKLKDTKYKTAHQLFLEYGVGLSKGSDFGDDNYLRINLACPRSYISESLARMEKALEVVK